jgi:hypothetical protein
MKNLATIFFIVLFCLLIAGCKKPASGTSSSGIIYKGVVLHNVCCLDVIETVGTDRLGQDNWVDSNTPPPLALYHHVFKVANPCQFGTHAEGDTIQFKVIQQEPQNCACCMLFIFTPATTYPIQVVN